MAKRYQNMFTPETAGLQFPFRARDESDQSRATVACNEALRNTQDMVHALAKKYMPSSLTIEDLEDVIQDCNDWLFRKSLPKYDSQRDPHVKVSTFLRSCIYNFVRQRRRLVVARKYRKNAVSVIQASNFDDMPAPDVSIDRSVEHVAGLIIENPQNFLTATQAMAFNAVVNNEDNTTMQEIAVRLHYKLPSSLSTMKKKIREKIVQIDLNGH